jgi:hypothetical protein
LAADMRIEFQVRRGRVRGQLAMEFKDSKVSIGTNVGRLGRDAG